MGGGHLLNFADELPERLRGRVEIVGAHCLKVCDNPHSGRPPFARVNRKLISNASIESLIEACDCALNKAEGGGHAL
jgi:hypothetical protein